MKLLMQTVFGIVALLTGVSLLYLFISRLNTGANFIFLIVSIIFIGFGAYLFFRVSKIANAIPQPSVEVVPTESGSKLLDKNNQIVKDYSQVNSKKDNLKAVQIAVSAQAETVAEGK